MHDFVKSLGCSVKGTTVARKKQAKSQPQPQSQLQALMAPQEVEHPDVNVTEPHPAEDQPNPAKRTKMNPSTSSKVGTSERSSVESLLNDNSAMGESFQSQPATPTTSMEYSSSESPSAAHPGTSSDPLMGSQLYPQLVHNPRDVVTTSVVGRKDTMSNSPPYFGGVLSFKFKNILLQLDFHLHHIGQPQLAFLTNLQQLTSTMAQPGTSGIPSVGHMYNQGIMYPPTAAARGVPYVAGQLAQAMIPSNFHLFGLEATGFNNGQHSLVPGHMSQAVRPYIDNRQYLTSKYMLIRFEIISLHLKMRHVIYS